MSTRADIRAALKRYGPLSVTELAQHCPSCEKDRQIVASAVAELCLDGKLKRFGLDGNDKPVYAIGRWPEEDEGTAPEPAPDQPAADPHEEEVMEKRPLAERVVEALRKHGNLNLDDLAKHAGTTKGTLYTMMGTFQKKHGVVKISRGVYGLGGARQAPPSAKKKKLARKVTKKKAVLRVRSDRPARKLARTPPAPKPNGQGPHFAINEAGELGIDAGEKKLSLDPEAFARLREFIALTEPVWKGASA